MNDIFRERFGMTLSIYRNPELANDEKDSSSVLCCLTEGSIPAEVGWLLAWDT